MPRAAFGVGAVAGGISTVGPAPNELKDSEEHISIKFGSSLVVGVA